MTVVIEAFTALPCELRVFRINRTDAKKCDFGDTADCKPNEAEAFCCADMKFTADPAKKEGAMRKYGLSETEYLEITERLRKTLDVGCCCCCL